MPTYEFRLPDGTIIEKAFRMSEVPDEIPNPDGDGTAVRIISGGAALVFKGSGFYLTDYGKNAHRTQGDAANTASGSESKAESAAAKSEPSGAKSSDAPTTAGKASEPKGPESTRSESTRSESKGSEPKAKEPKPSAASSSDSKPSGSGPAAP